MAYAESSVTPRECSLRVQCVELHYLEWGTPTNPPLLLLHGGSAHAHWWDHIATDLARDYWVLAFDLRGHGDSGWVVPPAYEIEDYVADLAQIVAALGLVSPILIGHSLGGFIALSYASAHAERLRALVVVDMGVRLRNSRFIRLLRHLPPPIYRDEKDVLRRFRLLPAETRAASVLLHHIARHSVRPLQDGLLQLKCDRATLAREPRTVLSCLPKITCPTLFMRGTESRTLSPDALSEMVHRCPSARGVEIPEAGHHVFLDNPAVFLEVVRQFLEEKKEDFSCKT